jgi:hypothetical protein
MSRPGYIPRSYAKDALKTYKDSICAVLPVTYIVTDLGKEAT